MKINLTSFEWNRQWGIVAYALCVGDLFMKIVEECNKDNTVDRLCWSAKGERGSTATRRNCRYEGAW